MLGKSLFGQALANLRLVGWLLLVVGVGLLLIQWKFSPAADSSRGKPHAAKRAADTVLPMNRVAANSDGHGDSPSVGEGAVPSKPTRWGPDVFEQIEWRRFEAVIEALFAKAGFETRSQSHGADGGVDVWLHARSNAEKPVSVVQCKHWVGKRVGVDKVRELKGVMASHGMSRGHFATTSTFTPDAIGFAKQNGIHLLDIEGILRLIDKRSQEDQSALLAVATEGEFWKPTCVNCGTKLVARSSRSGGKPFWGCSSFPRCRTTLPMRTA
jgi:restriction system protein